MLTFAFPPLLSRQAGDSVVGASDEFTFTVLVQDQNLDALREFVDGAADPTNALCVI